MNKLFENYFHKSLLTFYTLIGCLYLINNKCISCWSLQESVAAAYTSAHSDQIELNFSILEGVPIGTLIGVIKSTNLSVITQPPYLIVPVSGGIHKTNSSRSVSSHSVNGGGVDTDLNIDQSTGEIRTAVQLDREQRSYYAFIAIPLTGANIKVTIIIEDINDNPPQFPTDEIDLEFPENSKPRDVKRTLPPARDIDLGQFATQKYRIVSGNIGNAFRLLSHREKDDVLYLDLQVNGALDRETISSYTLVIEALDGGQPPLKDEMTVRIAILDHNDCEPVFSQSHYYGNIAENVTIGTSLLRVTATDNDQGDNGLITYSIHSKNSALSGLSTHFGINKINGWIFVAKPLDFESKELHELVVIARDSGAQPLETSAFVSIRVTDVNDNQPTINLLFLTETARPEIPENAKVGDLVARVSVNDADSSDSTLNSETNGETLTALSVSLVGNDGNFGLTTQDSVIYLIVVTGALDREKKSKYSLTVIVTDQGNPPLNTTTTFELEILDINDNPPYFESDTYHVTLPEAADIGSSVFRAKAIDPDSDSQISYSLVDMNQENSSNSKWFSIDSNSGLITTQSQVDCETDPTPKLIILATDTTPSKLASKVGFSATTTLIVSISDINDNEPIFDQSFYNITVREDEPIGNCILKISASDPDCGFNAMVNYTTMNTMTSIMSSNMNAYQQDFTIHPITGQLCIARQLDYETRNSYDIPVLATDRGGLSTTAMIKVLVVDTNDNYPIFYPREYKVSVPQNFKPIERNRHSSDSNGPTPLITVAANDRDSTGHPFGTITYAIKDGNEEQAFEIEDKTGKIFAVKPLNSKKALYQLTINAKDGGNRESKMPAIVHISVLTDNDPESAAPVFTQRQYNFKVYENVKSDTIVGTVSAKTDSKDSSNISYVIYSGDPDSYFTIDSALGIIKVRSDNIDHEKHSYLLLNVQAFNGKPGGPYRYGHTQVNVTIVDQNDNSPIFVTNNLKISVPENTFAHNVTILVANAIDYDSGIFGRITYSISSSEYNQQSNTLPFSIEPKTGAVTLKRELDFEQINNYKLKVTATDGANLSSNLFVEVLVQDSNDNKPVFTGTTSDERFQYKLNVLENSPINSQFFQVKAKDADTGNNARITYSLVSDQNPNKPFGIFPNNGILYIKEQLDRESRDKYEIRIKVTDHGSPISLTNEALMEITVIDVNDNRPQWADNSYVFTIVENTAVGTLIGKISATDSDLGNNASLRYNISDSQTSELNVFQLNPMTGEIYLKSTIDRELKDKYEFNVEVRDQGTPQPLYSEDKALVLINILDVNDNRPTFDSLDDNKPLTVSLGTPPGVIVGTVRANDPDFGENGTVYYSFIEEHDMFEIDRNSGAITTKHSIKDIASYKLSVIATDGSGKKSKVKILNIDVIHKIFDNFMYETADIHNIDVIESTSIGQVVGSFNIQTSKTYDQNSEQNCKNGFSTYYNTFVDQNIPFILESLNGPNLKLIVSNKLDFETKDKYNLIVCIDFDQCSLSLVDSEEVIRGTKHCKQYIKIKVNVVDDESDCNPFPIESELDSYEIKIPLNSVNKYRRLTDLLYLNGTNCQNIKYEITSPLIAEDVLKRLFNLNGNVLQFRPFDQSVIQKLLHEEFVMTLVAKKDEQNFRTIPVRVRLLSADKRIGNIGFINDKYIEIDEDCCKVGSNIIQLRINVSHEDFIIRYELNDYNNINTDFGLNSETGFLSLNREFDYERRQEYKINVTALVHDIKGLLISISTIITIKVLNSNDESPVFVRKLYEKEVIENVNLDVLLLQVEAKDRDDFGYSNLTYIIPEGYPFYEYFNMNKRNGELRLVKHLDREQYESFNIPIYAFDENFKHFAQTYARIKLIDVNDNTPYFLNKNYEIKIPESIAPGTLFHTFIALDKDLHGSGASKMALNYRILSGNTANKFSLHPQKGELSTNAALDREKQNIYHLVVEVSDSLHSSNCNLTIELTDVNDNAPVFDKTNYYAIIDNTISVTTNVVTVRAIDSDGDPVLYAINITNEFDRYFFIDSKTGEITVHTPSLTFISKAYNTNVFIFDVLAIEVGRGVYESHNTRATVHVTLLNNGHNSMPKLKSYPYIISVGGTKSDYRVGTEIGTIEVINSQTSTQTENMIYRVVNNGDGDHSFMDYFNIHSQSGAVVVKRPLNHDYYEAIIEVSKSPNSQLATRALLQVFVGGVDTNRNVNSMQFKVDLNENMPINTEIINLGLRSRTFNQKYVYNFAYSSVNYSYFSLNQNSGLITLREVLDYESKPSLIELVVFARRPHNSIDGNYFNITIELINVDDNAPQFTQKHYISSIKEGEPTGSFVAQISAIDIDNNKQTNSGRKPVTYHILEGNHDNAFTIDPPGSGIIRTNTVLDREIRDHYILKIVANDAVNNDNSHTSESQSNYQLSSHCTLEIIVIDVNDNVPVFPPSQEISISETEEVGTVITTLTANDVDTFPMLTYHKQRSNQLSAIDSTDLFDIGLYSGKITLKSRLTETNSLNVRNMSHQYILNIASSDSKHTVETQIVINVKRSGSQQKPIFTNESNFFVEIDSEDNNCVFQLTNCDIFRVSVHENRDINKKVIYSLGSESGRNGFYMDQHRGIIYNNKTLKSKSSKIFNLIVYAKYAGNEELSQASLLIKVLGTNYYNEKRDRIFNIETDMSQIGKTTLKLPKLNKNYAITGGNPNKNFVIFRGNELVLTKKPLKEEYSLRIATNSENRNNSILVNVRIKSSNEEKTSHNAFKSTVFDVEVNENEPIDTEVQSLKPIANTDRIKYRIFSGNELSDFRIDENNGIIFVNHLLNFENVNNYRLGVVAEVWVTDSQTVQSFAIININVININEHCPQFPISHYKTIIDENVAIGTKVIKLNAFDSDNDSVNYTVIKLMDTSSPFSYDYKTGYLITTDQIDYESIDTSPPVYKLLVRAVDSGTGHIDCSSIETLLEIQIGSVDEYSPRFTSESYSFKGLTTNGVSQVKVGQVLASDADSGPDGRVLYTLRSSSPTNVMEYFTVNSTSGTIYMTTTGLDFQRHFSLIISAASGRHNSLSSLTVVDVNLSIVSEGSDISGVIRAEDTVSAAAANPTSLPGWILFLIVLLMLITVVLLVSIIVIRLHQHQQQQHLMSDHVRHIGPNNIGSLLRKIGTIGGTDPNLPSYQSHHQSHYGSALPVPPCYNDVTLSSSGALASGEGHSASSGRGSAEEEEVEEDMDDVDEEIRMINENSNYYGDDGNSDVTTTAEYLARLGVINHLEEEDREESSTALEDEEEDDVMLEQLGAISTPRISSIRGQHRNRINTGPKTEDWQQMSGSMSSIVHSEEELSGSYNWDYLQHWGPKYQPLSSVFAEIARLKASNGEQDISAIEAMAIESGSTRSSSTASSSHRSHRLHMPVPVPTARVISIHPSPSITPQINSAFHSFSRLSSSPNVSNPELNNGLTVDEEIRI